MYVRLVIFLVNFQFVETDFILHHSYVSDQYFKLNYRQDSGQIRVEK